MKPTAAYATVLFVDDDQDLLQAYFDRFSQLGYKVMIAGSGLEGIEMIKKYTIDATVLDVTMPEMDGFKVLKAIRAIKPEMPIAFLTGRKSSELLSKTLELKSNCLIEKPCSTQELNNQLRRMIDTHRARKGA